MRVIRFCLKISLIIAFGNIDFMRASPFSGDITLEIFAFEAREDLSCEALLIQDPAIFKDAKPFAREKADITNNGGAVSFLLSSLSPKIGIVIFVRAINLATNKIYALGCLENIHATAREQKEFTLYLTPQ